MDHPVRVVLKVELEVDETVVFALGMLLGNGQRLAEEERAKGRKVNAANLAYIVIQICKAWEDMDLEVSSGDQGA